MLDQGKSMIILLQKTVHSRRKTAFDREEKERAFQQQQVPWKIYQRRPFYHVIYEGILWYYLRRY